MKFITAGESHGPALTAIVCDVPCGVPLDESAINVDLARRQAGYGRGSRQKIETDRVRVLSGVRFSRTLGTPITLQVENADHANWTGRMDVFGRASDDLKRETHPRPGHADLVGMLRNDTNDARNILERSSARETAARVAAGSIAKALLLQLGVNVYSYVCRIGDASLPPNASFDLAHVEDSPVRCPDRATTQAMIAAIDTAKENGVSLGGEFVVTATGLIAGLGSFASGPERLTSRLGSALFSIPAIKGVEFGMGFQAAHKSGDEVHDCITWDPNEGYGRSSNNAGGLEGGMTTGQPLVACCAMKPIPTMRSPKLTIDTDTHEIVEASKERSDVCAVPAAGVVAEAEFAFVLADAYTSLFGCTTLSDLVAARDAYLERISRR